jgi:hypothetical protein
MHGNTGKIMSIETKNKISKSKRGLIYRSKPIDPNSIQAKVHPDISNTRCYICRTFKVTKRFAINKFGIIPKSMCICHKCDNIYGKCCNPDHLFLGTHSDNAIDMVKKHRYNNTHKQTQETREKISKTMKGIVRSVEHCKNLSLKLTGRKHSKETIERIKIAQQKRSLREQSRILSIL